MTSDWPLTQIGLLASSEPGSLAVGPFGSRMKADLYVAEGVRVVRGNNLSDSVDLKGEFVHVAEETARGLASCQLKPGDLVFPHRGNIGAVGITPDDGHRYMLSTSLMKLSPDRQRASVAFLFYFFRSEVGRNALLVNSSQVGTPGIATPLKSLRSISVRLPPLETQLAIANTLSSLDDRIALLRETNATLEAIAQALFKSWFVDFDPVRAKSEGRAPGGMDEATAALFPDTFEDSPLGPIPSGWRLGHRSDQMELAKGSVDPAKHPDREYLHFSLPAFDSGEMPVRQYGRDIKSNKTVVPPTAVLLSKLNPHIPRVWLPSEVAPHAICSTEFLPFVPTERTNMEFVYCLLRSTAFMESMAQLVTGTSNSHQRIRPASVASQQCSVAPSEVVQAFSGLARPLVDAIRANRQTGQTLARLRDELLPRLISGRLRIADAEEC
jgi:type I restriction enzyme, S subunit